MGVRSIALQPDGKIVLVVMPDGWLGMDLEVARLNPNGTLDASFGSGGITVLDPDGYSDSTGATVLIQPNGKLIVAGSIQEQAALFRLNSDGTLDTTFGGGSGYVMDAVSDFLSSFMSGALETNGDIVVSGDNIDNQYDSSAVAARFLPSGALDTTFNGDGNAAPSFRLRRQLCPGHCACKRMANSFSPPKRMRALLLRLNANGSVDAGFGAGGLVSLGDVSISAPVIQGDGRIVVGGEKHIQSTADTSTGLMPMDHGIRTLTGPANSSPKSDRPRTTTTSIRWRFSPTARSWQAGSRKTRFRT